MGLLTLTTRQPDHMIDQAIQDMIGAAGRDWNGLQYQNTNPITGFGISILRPRDLNIGNGTTLTGTAQSSIYWGYSFAAASTWYDIVKIQVHADAYILVTGVFDLNTVPLVTQLKPTINGNELPICPIESLYAEETNRAWFNRPIPYGVPKTNFTISAVAKNSHSAYWLGFDGYVVGKRSYLIAT